MPVELEWDDEGAKVRLWRQECLERAGFSEFTAFRLAMRLDIPKERAIHYLRDLAMSEQQIVDELIED